MSLAKPKTYRNRKYLDWVATQRCLAMGWKPDPDNKETWNDPCHFGPRGVGLKTDDYRTIPLRNKKHLAGHARGEKTLFRTNNIDVKLEQIKLMCKYLEEKYNIDGKEEVIQFLMESIENER